MEEKYRGYDIVFFDGVCNFCNAAVDRIYRRNKKRNIYYSSLQSEFAKKNLPPEATNNIDTIIFYSGGNLYYRSSAVLQIAKRLDGAYRLLVALYIFPRFIRDAVYKLIAKNRYKWFGKKESCRIPTAGEKKYFLE
ncbi:MAG: thiol-disulfide oxidoreductase [Bacteroidetes bacterium]|nr:thiol-disulfide oxidoreductase [Bacteroidota bacterium]